MFIKENHLIYGPSNSRHLLDSGGNDVLLNDLLSDSFGLNRCGIFFNSTSMNSGNDFLFFKATHCPYGTKYSCLLTLTENPLVSYCINNDNRSILDLDGKGESIVYSDFVRIDMIQDDYYHEQKTKHTLYLTNKKLSKSIEIDSSVSFSGFDLLKLSDDCFMAIDSESVRAYCR